MVYFNYEQNPSTNINKNLRAISKSMSKYEASIGANWNIKAEDLDNIMNEIKNKNASTL